MDNVLCMKWGTKYPSEYVNILAQNVRRFLKRPHRFVCFTDDSNGLDSRIDVLPLPELDLPAGLPERGWNKLTLFKKDLGGLEGTALFLDLDLIILQPLDPFFDLPGDFRIIRDWNLKKKDIGNSSVFRFQIGQCPDILDNFLRNGEELRANHRNEQAVLSFFMRRKGLLQYWPEQWCLSFKRQVMRSFPFGYFMKPKKQPNAKIIVFHGMPFPTAVHNGWHGHCFLRAVRPTPWLADFWKIDPNDPDPNPDLSRTSEKK